jgi:hypothetical protein
MKHIIISVYSVMYWAYEDNRKFFIAKNSVEGGLYLLKGNSSTTINWSIYITSYLLAYIKMLLVGKSSLDYCRDTADF